MVRIVEAIQAGEAATPEMLHTRLEHLIAEPKRLGSSESKARIRSMLFEQTSVAARHQALVDLFELAWL